MEQQKKTAKYNNLVISVYKIDAENNITSTKFVSKRSTFLVISMSTCRARFPQLIDMVCGTNQ